METFESSPPRGSPQTELFPMSSSAGSPVRTSARWAAALALTAKSQVYGGSSHGSLARFDPASSSWKTPQSSLDEGSETFSETWPVSGMMRSGIAYQLPTLALVTDETGLGLFPTPLASETGFRRSKFPQGGTSLSTFLGGRPNPDWIEWLMNFPIRHTALER
jgi:hypothetical protein